MKSAIDKKKVSKKENTVNNTKEINKSIKDKNFYFGFYKRIIVYVVLLITFLFFSILVLRNALTISIGEKINYNEISNLDYKVYLLPNEFYEKEYLEKDMLYVANLIDKINLNFDYSFKTDIKTNVYFTYNIMAKLTITDKVGQKSYYEKEYTLLENQNLQMKNNNIQTIKEDLNIDYLYYNNIANKFRNAYGIDTDSKLDVYMVVNKSNSKNYNYSSSENVMNIVIPLSQKTINIEMKANENNNTSSILQQSGIYINNYFLLITGIVLMIIVIIIIIRIIKRLLLLRTKKNKYDIVLDKILKQYDRLIAESLTTTSFENKNIIKLKSFTELLDVHDNLQLPIIYYQIVKHHKCYFYINSKEDIYLYILKAADLEVDKNAKN